MDVMARFREEAARTPIASAAEGDPPRAPMVDGASANDHLRPSHEGKLFARRHNAALAPPFSLEKVTLRGKFSCTTGSTSLTPARRNWLEPFGFGRPSRGLRSRRPPFSYRGRQHDQGDTVTRIPSAGIRRGNLTIRLVR